MATTTSATELLASQWPYITSTILACAAVWLFQRLLTKDPLSSLPMAGSELGDTKMRRQAYLENAKRVYVEGYRKFKNSAFTITTLLASPTIVLPPRFLVELKNLPEDTVSFSAAINESMQTKHIKIQSDDPIITHVVKKSLTPALNRLNPTIADEVDQSIQEELPPCKEFTDVNINSALLRIVAKVSGRIFIGPELCRSETYIDAAINYTIEIMTAVHAVTQLPPWQRRFRGRSLPQVKSLSQRQKAAQAFLEPIIVSRKNDAKNPDYQAPDDMLQWLIDGGQDKFGQQGDSRLAGIQLALSFAAIHTTTAVTTNAFYNLAVMPEIIPELREEIREVLNEHGTFTTAALQQMKKLDSFLRETMRHYPLTWTSFNRKVLKTFTLSNGQVIPAGSMIEVPAYSTNFDPEVVENPEQFDAFRSYRAREQKGSLEGTEAANVGATNQFVTVSPNNLLFGYGRHACPGRFFAANEIKMILSRMMLDYDIRAVPGSKGRYPNIPFGQSTSPDPTKVVQFKRIAV